MAENRKNPHSVIGHFASAMLSSIFRGAHRMTPIRSRIMMGLAIAAVVAGCERPLAKQATQPPMRVEVVKPERRTVERAVGEPGQLLAVETTPIHAKIAGYVQSVSVD